MTIYVCVVPPTCILVHINCDYDEKTKTQIPLDTYRIRQSMIIKL